MNSRLITVELLDDGSFRTVVKAGLSMDQLGQILAGITRAGITAHLKKNDLPDNHREPLEKGITQSYYNHVTAGFPRGSKANVKQG